jgi:hypothetical protein
MEQIRIRSGIRDGTLGSGIRDGKNSDPGSGINIPDPQHWYVKGSVSRKNNFFEGRKHQIGTVLSVKAKSFKKIIHLVKQSL